MSSEETLRVAVTLVQCWQPVPGGTATAALRLTDALAQRDDVELVGIGPRGTAPPPPAFWPSIPVVRQRLPYQLLYEAWHRGLEAPERITGPVDLVHATAPMTPPVRSARLVMTLHDLFPVLEPANLTQRGVRMMTRALDLAKRDAGIVMCSSRQTFADCVDHGFDEERLRLVPLGADPVPVDESARDRVRTTNDLHRPYVVWVGTVEPRKNLPMLLDAFRLAAADDLELILVGPDGWSVEIDSIVAESPSIRRLGFVPRDDLPVILDGARALLFPSRREGFGLPAIEAMAQGTPVIGAAGTAIAEIVGDTGLLIDPDDRDAWVDAIRMVAAESNWAESQDTECRQRAAAFTWDRTAELTMQAYRDAVRQ